MDSTQQKITATIESCLNHSHIDTAIQMLENYIALYKHEQRFFHAACDRILMKIVTLPTAM